MLAKKYKLPIQEMVGKKAKSVKTKYLSVKIFPNTLPYCRFGVLVSKKIAARAADRNRIKRQVFNAIRKRFFSGKEITGLHKNNDFLVIPFPEFSKLAKKEAEEDINQLLNQLK